MKKLKHSEEELRKIYTYQKNVIGRTFYEEKDATENVFHNRFHFLLVIYSLFMGAFMLANNNNKILQLIILSTGLAIIIIMGLALYRIHIRLDILLRILYQFDNNHVLPIVDDEIKNLKFRLFKVNSLIVVFIPVLLILSFFAIMILVIIDVL